MRLSAFFLIRRREHWLYDEKPMFALMYFLAQLMNVLVEGGYRDLPFLSVMHNATRGTRRYPSCFATSEVANKTAML